MSISLQTAYPCIKCSHELAPDFVFCPYCGEKQPDKADLLVFNVFTVWPIGGSTYHRVFGGDPIQSFDDLMEAATTYCAASEEYYLASYKQEDVDDQGRINVRSWIRVHKGSFSADSGRRLITVNVLE